MDCKGLLGTLLSGEIISDEKCRILEEDFDIPMTQPLERKVGIMCNLSEGVFTKGVKQGMKLQEAETIRMKEEWQIERNAYVTEIARLQEQVARLQQNGIQ